MAIVFQLLRRSFSFVAEAKIISDHNVRNGELFDQLRDEFLPRHLHHMAVEVKKNNIINAEQAPDNVLSPDGAVDQLDLAPKHKIVGMNVKADDRRDRAALLCTLLRSFQKGGVADMHAVKKTDGNGAFDLSHAHTSKKLLIVYRTPPSARPSISSSPEAE